MKKIVHQKLPFSYVVLFFMIILGVAFIYPKSISALIVIFILVFILHLCNKWKTKHHFSKLLNSRASLTIGDFAREFNCKEVDTWVIRATYEQVQSVLLYVENFPIKASDRLKEDLLIHDDDIDFDLVFDISLRTGRSLDNCENNPYYGRVKTVADLVMFFNNQQ